MGNSITKIFCAVCAALLISCQIGHKRSKSIRIFCDNFPEIKIDSIKTDTVGLMKYVDEVLTENKSDSINFTIECPDNIEFPSVTRTESILKKQISLHRDGTAIVTIYNKCLSPSKKDHTKTMDIVVKVDSRGLLSIDNKSITIDSICEEYHGQNITIQIIADNKLSMDKFTALLKRLERENFKVILGH